MNNGNIKLLPSLLCGDLYNLEKSVEDIISAGYDTVHVDILDGHFSPSMPLGLESVYQMKQRSNVKMDVHIMSTNNEFFINKLVDMGCWQICFHYETTEHVDQLINSIKNKGIRVGLALKPATPIWVLEEIADSLDFVLLMLINPGYAGSKYETQVPYALEKIKRCQSFLNKKKLNIPIEIDGRIKFGQVTDLLEAGAKYFVGGSGLSYLEGATLEQNRARFNEIVQNRRNYGSTGL